MKIASLGKVALPFIWFGAVCAISFMEAPLKFNAPNLTTPVALEIGHIVFDALNKAEWVLIVLLGISLFLTKPTRIEVAFYSFTAVILLVQTFWLFPILDARTIAVINSQPIPASNYHWIYIVLEAIKVMLLLALGIFSLRSLLKEH